ncbi:MAG: SMC-Scp complex subunit ScpB [Candidatus Hodarchaeales archaeon]|jgi:chromosome segregation and condensation protein ScpB
MWKLFGRRKKEKKPKDTTSKEKVDANIAESPFEDKKQSGISEETQVSEISQVSDSETSVEEKKSIIPEIIAESIPEIIEVSEPQVEFLPFVTNIIETEDTVFSFISPELLRPQTNVSNAGSVSTVSLTSGLPPITLMERVEGALFSVGRPIHTKELIENLQEESVIVKRAIRKLQRRRKRNSPILVEEISKDRWVLQLNPLYHDFFESLSPEKFMSDEERRILTEISYRQPISLAMVKKIVRKIGPIKITEICQNLEKRGYIVGEKRARSLVYTSTSKFAQDFGFDDESRRLKLQMLWRLKRLMGDYEAEEEEVEEAEIPEGEVEKVKTTEGDIEEAEKEEVEEAEIPEGEVEKVKTTEGDIEEAEKVGHEEISNEEKDTLKLEPQTDQEEINKNQNSHIDSKENTEETIIPEIEEREINEVTNGEIEPKD